ncbi:hypothetical protein HDE_00771 [Halotydeus destructor]|nr:hypothetical protein HDE_00771 [Halotydeus destructor]
MAESRHQCAAKTGPISDATEPSGIRKLQLPTDGTSAAMSLTCNFKRQHRGTSPILVDESQDEGVSEGDSCTEMNMEDEFSEISTSESENYEERCQSPIICPVEAYDVTLIPKKWDVDAARSPPGEPKNEHVSAPIEILDDLKK